jgi:hypothetical protein
MNDCRRSKRVAGLRLTSCDRHIGNEAYDNKLQTDQGTGRRPDDYEEVLPSDECCHAVTSSSVAFAQGKDTGSNPGSSFLTQSGDVLGRRIPEEAAVFSAELGSA